MTELLSSSGATFASLRSRSRAVSFTVKKLQCFQRRHRRVLCLIDSVVEPLGHQPAPVTSVGLLDVDPLDAYGWSSGSFDCLCVRYFLVHARGLEVFHFFPTDFGHLFRVVFFDLLWFHHKTHPSSNVRSSCLDLRVPDLLCLHELPCKANLRCLEASCLFPLLDVACGSHISCSPSVPPAARRVDGSCCCLEVKLPEKSDKCARPTNGIRIQVNLTTIETFSL